MFSDCRQGVRYKGEIIEQELRIELFGWCELYKVQNSHDPLNTLPLPEPNAADEEEPIEDIPASINEPEITEIDFEAIENAVNPTNRNLRFIL